MANRTTRIGGRVRAALGLLDNQRLTDALLYSTMDDVSRRIAEDALCLEAKMNLAVTASGTDYDLATAGGTLVTSAQYGTVNGKTEAVVNSTNTTLTFDKAFTQTYVDLLGNTVPAYRFVIQEARQSGSTINEEILIVSQTLTSITLRAPVDSVYVKFICLSVASSIENPSGATSSGFFRMRYIELPASFQWQLEEVTPVERDDHERYPQANTGQSPLVYSIYNNIITFYPAPLASATYVIHYWKVPTVSVSSSVEPETESHFDTALYYGTCAELSPVAGIDGLRWDAKYAREIDRVIGVHRTRKSHIGQIHYHDF